MGHGAVGLAQLLVSVALPVPRRRSFLVFFLLFASFVLVSPMPYTFPTSTTRPGPTGARPAGGACACAEC